LIKNPTNSGSIDTLGNSTIMSFLFQIRDQNLLNCHQKSGTSPKKGVKKIQ